MKSLLARAEEGLIALLLVGMTSVTFMQVVLRYGANSGVVWAHEATTYMFGWLIMIGISYGVRVNAHIGVDVVVMHAPRPLRRLFGLLAVGLCLLYAGMMLYGSWGLVSRLFELGTYARDIPLPRWLLTSAMPLGFALLAWRLLEVGVAIVRGERDALGVGHEDGGDPDDPRLAADRVDPDPGIAAAPAIELRKESRS